MKSRPTQGIRGTSRRSSPWVLLDLAGNDYGMSRAYSHVEFGDTEASQKRHELRNTGNAEHGSEFLPERSSQTTEQQHTISSAGGVSALRLR